MMKNLKNQQRKDVLNIIKYTILSVFFLIIMLAGAGAVIYASIMQCILIIEKYGALIDIVSFIPHKSAWFYLGSIPLFSAITPCSVCWAEADRLHKIYKARKKNGWYDKNTEDNV
jgi:hypothetical protein